MSDRFPTKIVDETEEQFKLILQELKSISARLLNLEEILDAKDRAVDPQAIENPKPIKVRTRVQSVSELTRILENRSIEAKALIHTGEEVSGVKE